MHIAMAFDEHYVRPARVAVESILRAHPDADLNLWLVNTASAWRSHADAVSRQVGDRAALHLLSADDGLLSLPRSTYRWITHVTTGTYLRFQVPQLLPSDLTRMLYLDADVLCRGDLRPLWTTPLGGLGVAAVRDVNIWTVANFGGMPGAAGRLEPDAAYFNSGVLLIDLPHWRAEKITESCIEYVTDHRHELRFSDQDALNLAFGGRWQPVAAHWNHIQDWRPRPDGGPPPEPPAEVRIVHFAGVPKPWYADFPPGPSREHYATMAGHAGVTFAAADAQTPPS